MHDHTLTKMTLLARPGCLVMLKLFAISYDTYVAWLTYFSPLHTVIWILWLKDNRGKRRLVTPVLWLGTRPGELLGPIQARIPYFQSSNVMKAQQRIPDALQEAQLWRLCCEVEDKGN